MRTVRRSLVPALIVLALTLGAAGCHRNIVFENPQAQKAYTADQVLQRVGEFQGAVIVAEENGGLVPRDAKMLMLVCNISIRTLAAVPKGWTSTAIQGAWQTLRATYLPALPADVPAAWPSVVKTMWAAVKVRFTVIPSALSTVWATVDVLMSFIPA